MGYGIEIIMMILVDGKYMQEVVGEEYLSYNWTRDRFFQFWDILKDLNGKSSKNVQKNIDMALKAMSYLGHKIGVPDISNPNWGYGNDMTYKNKASVFMHHLNRFRILTEKFPDAYWVTDYYYPKQINYEGKLLSLKTVPHAEKSGNLVTYFRHPIKGQMKVSTFDDAMEIFGLMRAKGDSRAILWKDLAFKMHDSPIKK
jgi:hypothetical protein